MITERRYRRVELSDSFFRFEPAINGDIICSGEMIDEGDRVIFSNLGGTNKYTIFKSPHLKREGEEPTIDNYDWGKIFRIYAIVKGIPFYEDCHRTGRDRLFYLDNLNNIGIGELLKFDEGNDVYCGKGNPTVRISHYHCYTGLTSPDGPLYVFNVGGSECYFV